MSQTPDIAVLYCHGGGFSMGSTYFYLEFLLAWIDLLQKAGYKNPAILSLDYTLVPDASYPTQLHQAVSAYQYLLSITRNSNRICVSGDSAGGTLALSLLLSISRNPILRERKPGYATLISPWVSLVSPNNRNTASDYLDAARLELYGRQYLGSAILSADDIASPGNCKDVDQWLKASPMNGWFFIFGSEEVLGPEIRELVQRIRKCGKQVDVVEQLGAIHAWPVASLYLGEHREARLHGIAKIVARMSANMGAPK
jgi:acetyl esterase/lipase